MDNINVTIEQYKKTRENIKKRIEDLNIQINKFASNKRDSMLKQLCDRRNIMCIEVCGIEYAISQMLEYENQLSARKVIRQ